MTRDEVMLLYPLRSRVKLGSARGVVIGYTSDEEPEVRLEWTSRFGRTTFSVHDPFFELIEEGAEFDKTHCGYSCIREVIKHHMERCSQHHRDPADCAMSFHLGIVEKLGE